jgi:hypothetical protein
LVVVIWCFVETLTERSWNMLKISNSLVIGLKTGIESPTDLVGKSKCCTYVKRIACPKQGTYEVVSILDMVCRHFLFSATPILPTMA